MTPGKVPSARISQVLFLLLFLFLFVQTEYRGSDLISLAVKDRTPLSTGDSEVDSPC
jgi:hypothetical protein